MRNRISCYAVVCLASMLPLKVTAEVTKVGGAQRPQVLDRRMKLELFAEAPDIVTPVGLTFDRQGRLLVIESHTHFPPDDYDGPKTDRIRLVEDTTGDGKADRFRSFLEGTRKTMSLRRGPKDWIYIATRMQVFRVRTSGDDKADVKEVIATLETEGDYPHNGLGGLCLDQKGNLYFGLGENLGKSYEIVGSDGTRFKGGGEGGNIYRCRLDGSKLKQVATGFWNPFGICTDSVGRLFTVGNDPDASPPCRLVHVVDGGDYGYQFRYGRSGKHPLQAWDGELPGTLPMVAGTSEAPSGVVLWHGQLYGSSWGEYRIERFTLKPNGASVSAEREVVVQGDNQFRPVDFALAPDGSLYFSDWVDRSYNVHGKGRIWRLSWKQEPPKHVVPPISKTEGIAQAATSTPNWTALSSFDPFLHHAAMMGFVNSQFLTVAKLSSLEDGRHRLGVVQAARRSQLKAKQRDRLIATALKDADSSVQLYAIRWIADDRLMQFRKSLDQVLDQRDSTVSLFMATVAAIEWLDVGKVQRKRIAGETALVAALKDKSRPAIQAMALKSLPPDHQALTVSFLAEMVTTSDLDITVRREAARNLSVSQATAAVGLRLKLSLEPDIPAQMRADLLAGLDPHDRKANKVLTVVAGLTPGPLQKQAARLLTALTKNTQTTSRPNIANSDAWSKLLRDPGNADRGWRVFFGHRAARCANCHRLDGRGADVGPDLSEIGRRMDRRRLVQSIIQPSQEIGPRYVPWNIQTSTGQSLIGMSLGISHKDQTEQFLTKEGKQVSIPIQQIESRKLISQSIMPDGIHEQFTIDELRDLLALLSK